MTIIHLYDNLSGSFGPAAAAGQQYTIGTIFSSTDADQITALRWYRAGVGASYAPTRVTLWDPTTGTAVADPAVVDSGLVGWQTCPLGLPYTLAANRQYRLTQTIPTGTMIARVASGSRGTPPAPLAWGSSMRCYSPGNAYPTTLDNADALGVDVVLDTASGSPGPTPSGDALSVGSLRSEFSNWESADPAENLHQTALPWVTRALIQAQQLDVTALRAVADAIKVQTDKMPTAVAWIINGTLDKLVADADATLANLNSFSGSAQPILTGNPTGPNPGSGNALKDLYTGLQSLQTVTIDTLQSQLQACCNWLTGAVLDEALLTAPVIATLNGNGFANTGRRIHRLAVTAIPQAQGRTSIGGHLWLPRFGWWAPVTSQGSVLERHYIDWQYQWLWPCPASTVGVAYWLPEGIDATLYAYNPVAVP